VSLEIFLFLGYREGRRREGEEEEMQAERKEREETQGNSTSLRNALSLNSFLFACSPW